MQSRIAVVFSSLMISGSGFLSFANLPPAASPQTPYGRFAAYFSDFGWSIQAFQNLPILAQAFALSFLLPLPLLVLGFMGLAPRILGFAASFLTLGTLLYSWFGGRDQVEQLGRTLPSGPILETFSRLSQQAGVGFWLWVGGALLLLLVSLLDPGNDL